MRRVLSSSPDYHVGEHRCEQCGFHDDWGLFQTPPLQTSLPFKEARPEEQQRRIRNAAENAALNVLLGNALGERGQRYLPDGTVREAILNGPLTLLGELQQLFCSSLAEAVDSALEKQGRPLADRWCAQHGLTPGHTVVIRECEQTGVAKPEDLAPIRSILNRCEIVGIAPTALVAQTQKLLRPLLNETGS